MRVVTSLPEYIVYQGWSRQLARELVDHSDEPTIRRYTPNDHAKRFMSVDAAELWYQNPDKAPTVYILRSDLGELAGVAWLSTQTHAAVDPSYQTTFAIRLYDSARGRGLAVPFAAAVLADAAAGGTKKTWLETAADNPVAQHVYRKLGYEVVTSTSGRVVMCRGVE